MFCLLPFNLFWKSDFHPRSKIIKYVHNISKEDITHSPTPNDEFATGGIVTKLISAKMILEHKKEMFLVNGLDLKDAKSYLLDGIYTKGTFFKAK